ncbi:hypothetical protein Goarm_007891, partial [Gossypium armourianum]|nr:hypothetical protein [Gossypium armourianum]
MTSQTPPESLLYKGGLSWQPPIPSNHLFLDRRIHDGNQGVTNHNQLRVKAKKMRGRDHNLYRRLNQEGIQLAFSRKRFQIMEEEILSVISSGGGNTNSDVSNSISTTHQANKRQRCGDKGNSSQFKGVMRQKNGKWGAQLYSNHTRIWLGTFKTEIDAAVAYDSATIKFCPGDTHRNFPWNEITIEEPKFLSHYSAEAVLSMIRDGSYQYKFMDFIKACSRSTKPNTAINSVGTYSNEGLICKQ